MTHLVVLSTAILALAADAPSDKDAVKKEMERFQGTWKIESLEVNGNQVPEETRQKIKLVVEGKHWTVHVDDRELPGLFEIAPTQKPKAIDLIAAEGPNEGQKMHGIYTLEGDTLKMCRRLQPDQERPTKFATDPESSSLLVVWKREKK